MQAYSLTQTRNVQPIIRLMDAPPVIATSGLLTRKDAGNVVCTAVRQGTLIPPLSAISSVDDECITVTFDWHENAMSTFAQSQGLALRGNRAASWKDGHICHLFRKTVAGKVEQRMDECVRGLGGGGAPSGSYEYDSPLGVGMIRIEWQYFVRIYK